MLQVAWCSAWLLSAGTDGHIVVWDLRDVVAGARRAVLAADAAEDVGKQGGVAAAVVGADLKAAWQARAESGLAMAGSVLVHQSGINGFAVLQQRKQQLGESGDGDGDGDGVGACKQGGAASWVAGVATCGDDNAVCLTDIEVRAPPSSDAGGVSVRAVRKRRVEGAHAANATCAVAISEHSFATSGADCRLNLWAIKDDKVCAVCVCVCVYVCVCVCVYVCVCVSLGVPNRHGLFLCSF